MTHTDMKKERNGAVSGQETNLEYTAHLLEAAAVAADPGFSYAAPPPLGSHTGSSCLYDCGRQTGRGNKIIQVTLGQKKDGYSIQREKIEFGEALFFFVR